MLRDDFDESVQFWVDLIQIRAPGSTIIIVGTKSDLIPENEIQTRINKLRDQLKNNENKRVKAMKKETQRNRNTSLLQRLLKQRPYIADIIPVSCTARLSGLNQLTKLILDLSTPTPKNPYPFQLVNIEIPRYYLDVKEEIESMLRTCSVTHMQQLHNNMRDRKESNCTEMTINDTRDAVTFLSSIGEVLSHPLQT